MEPQQHAPHHQVALMFGEVGRHCQLQVSWTGDRPDKTGGTTLTAAERRVRLVEIGSQTEASQIRGMHVESSFSPRLHP